MIQQTHIDRLAWALAVDCQLQKGFLAGRLEAIKQHNIEYARRFGEPPIELNDEEERLVNSIKAYTIQQVYEILDLAMDAQAKQLQQLEKPLRTEVGDMLPSKISAA